MVATALVLVAALLHATWNTLIKFSGERLLLIPFGMVCLLWQGGGGEQLPWSMLPVVLLIGLCIGCYTFLDGQALRRWSHPLDYLVWLTLISAWPFPLLALVRKRAAFSLFWRTQWR